MKLAPRFSEELYDSDTNLLEFSPVKYKVKDMR